jgi:hypothetical protein
MPTCILPKFSLIVFLCIVQTGLSQNTFDLGPLTYQELETAVQVVDCLTDATDVVIPDTVNGKPVTSIAAGAFAVTRVKTISIPTTVTSIGHSAFWYATRLRSITIPTGVTTIEPKTFFSCHSLETANLHSKIASIGAEAFVGCTKLQNLVIPQGTAVIGEFALLGCKSITSLTVPDNVSRIGKGAFSGTGILSIHIPANVDFNTDMAFADCGQLSHVRIDADWTRVGETMFGGCRSLESIKLPNSVVTIGRGGFSGSRLMSVELPNVRKIEDEAFEQCWELRVVRLSKALREVGNKAFSRCGKLKAIHFSGNEPRTGSRLFDWTSSRLVVYLENSSKGFTYPLWKGKRVTLPREEIDVYSDRSSLDGVGRAVLKFGAVPIKTAGVVESVYIRNNGNRPLENVRVALTGSDSREFAIRANPPSTIKPGETARVKILFKPTKAMKRESNLIIMSSDRDEGRLEITLTGLGTKVL